MTFGRWLLIHSFSIFLVVLLVLGYIYREELKLEQAYTQMLNLGDSETVGVTLKQDSQPQPAQEISQSVKADDSPETGSTEAISAPPVLNQSIAVKPTIVQTESHQQDLLFDARAAYWQREYSVAIEKYRQLINRDPKNPDYSGELGNIYYAMNDYRNASELYFRTAQLLLQQGQREEAGQLLPPLNAMNRELGDQLKRNLQQQ